MKSRGFAAAALAAWALLPGAALPWQTAQPRDSPPSGVLVRYGPPVALDVVRPFVAPADRYSAGHRGVDLRAAPGQLVVAAGDGVVRFAGRVAGRGVVVIAHRDGISTEYEPVHVLVRAGTAVRRGTPIARVQGHHPGCPATCVHWGARRGPDYLDPLLLLRPLGPVVLLPWPDHG